MDPLMLTAAISMLLGIFLAVLLFFDVSALPGRIAERRSHPNAQAIKVLGIVGLPAGIVLWLAALVWAFAKAPAGAPSAQDEGLRARLAAAEAELARARSAGGAS